MADNTRVVSSRSVVREQAIQYIRPIILNLTLIDARPNTRMYVFFGGENVTDLCAPKGSVAGTEIITNAIGQASITLSIPRGRFNIGTYEILVTDTNNLSFLETAGSIFGSASATFTSTGKIQFFQETRTTITTVQRIVEVMKQPNLDPLAQSFFTFGVKGGMFLSSIDLYFNTKDPSVPVSVEVRELINGYPSNKSVSNINFVSVLSPDNVYTSADASIPTKFEFNPPIYLREDGEFCFVVRSNSSQYNVFTSEMGETSIESNAKIYENPYIGSLFKSENNITWTAYQSEDIKFTLRKAVFGPSGSVQFAAEVPPVIANGTQFTTVSGSNVITYTSNYEHGLETGSKLHIIARTAGTYNGIPGEEMNGTHVVTVIDRNTATFEVTSNASSTGQMLSSSGVVHVQIDKGGSGYSSSDTISFSGGNGTGAVANLTVNTDGAITSVTLSNVGSGYTTSPDINIITSTGTGAELTAIVTPVFTVYQNKPMTSFKPNISVYNFGSTSTLNTLSTTIGNYAGGNLVTYSPGREYEFSTNAPYFVLDQNSLVTSSYNNEFASNDISTLVSVQLQTDNPNISPVIDLKSPIQLIAYSSKVDNQPYDDLNSNNTSGSVTGITALVGGSGYIATPTVTIDPPYYSWGVQATATATMTDGAVTNVTITNAGSGYIEPPNMVIVRGSGDTTGAGASVQATINNFNTELLPTGGLAKSKYITRKFTLQTISGGVKLLCTLSSVPGSSVDWYIRTSLSSSGLDHESQQWQKLICNVDRTRSSFIGEVFEYEFKLDSIESFDTYDLKCVLLAEDPSQSPVVTGYRAVILA